MSWMLDTCALSEKLQKRPNSRFTAWLEAQDVDDLHVSALSLGEIRKGINLLPDSARKKALDRWFTGELLPFFEGRILSIGLTEAIEWGNCFARSQLAGHKPPVIDSLLAATALAHDLTIVTRNDKDFCSLGVAVRNPWTDS